MTTVFSRASNNDLFSTTSLYYKRIIELLAEGSMEYGKICETLKVTKSSLWSGYLDELVKAGFITKSRSWNFKTGKVSQLVQYRLSDNYLRFYLKCIELNAARIESGDFAFAEKDPSELPGWDTLMELQFENLVLNNIKNIWEVLRISPSEVLMHGPFFQKKTQRQKGCQIDYLLETHSHTFIVGEIKFSRQAAALGLPLIESVHQKIARLSIPQGYICWPVLIYVGEVSDSLRQAGFFSHFIDFSSLLF